MRKLKDSFLTLAHGRAGGFTLVEVVMVIVITGIIAGIVAVFIKSPIEAYISAARRADLTDAADISLRQFAREVRLALPNSLRVGTTGNVAYIEFILTRSGGRYRDVADGSTAGNNLDFINTANKTFDVLGTGVANPATGIVANNDYVVVYNLGPGYSPADAYTAPGPGGNRAQVGSVATTSITLTSNPFAAATPPLPSPNSRVHVVPSTIQAVTYSCPTTGMLPPGNLMRYWNYGFNPSIATPPASNPPVGSPAIALSNVTCEVDYTANVSQRNGLLYIKLTVTDGTSSGENVTVFRQIHVDNSP